MDDKNKNLPRVPQSLKELARLVSSNGSGSGACAYPHIPPPFWANLVSDQRVLLLANLEQAQQKAGYGGASRTPLNLALPTHRGSCQQGQGSGHGEHTQGSLYCSGSPPLALEILGSWPFPQGQETSRAVEALISACP